MQVSVENTSTLGRKLTINVPKEKVEAEKAVKLSEVKTNINLKGFRKGHVPEKFIKDKYGKNIHDEAVATVIESTIPEVIQQEEINLASRPSVDSIDSKEGENLTFTVTLEVLPKFELKDFAELTLEKLTADITDADVEKGVKRLQEQFGEFADANREIKEGDSAIIDFEGYIDGEKFDNGSGTDVPIEVGANQFIPGFEDGIVGMKPGDEKTINVKFPEDYHGKDVAGKDAEFKITVKSMQEKVLRELDEEFAKNLGIEDGDVGKINEKVRENMTKYLEDAIKVQMRDKAVDALIEAYNFDLPESMLSEETKALEHDFKARSNMQETEELSADDKKTIAEDAKKRVTLSLLVREISEKYELKPDAEQVRARINQMAMMYGSKAEQVRSMYYQSKELMQSVHVEVLTSQVADLVAEKATITEKQSSFYDIASKWFL